MSTKVVQITNIAPQATKDQMQNLFGCIGKIDEIRLYPTVRDVTCPVNSRVCYVKFFDSSCVAVAQHLTNTVFIDRALIVCPVSSGSIPDEFKALEIINNGSSIPGLPASDSYLPPEVVNRVEGIHPLQVIKTSDPKLEEYNLPEYPPLPIGFDARKIEEIRRTIIVIDIPADWELQEILEHFARAGEVKFARFAEKSRQKHVMIEFCEQKSVISALKMQGTEFLGKRLNIYHSMQAILKPEAKSNEAAQREIEEAMSIVKETQNIISAALDPVIGILSSKEKSVPSHRRTRSRSRSSRSSSRRRSRSRKRSKRTRSRSRGSRRKRSRSRSNKRRSVSRSRSKRSRSRSKRPRSRDRERRKRSRSRRRTRSPRSRTRSHDRRERERERRERDRERKRERELSNRRRSRSPQTSKTSRKTSRKEEKHRKSRSRSRSHERRHSAKESTTRRERRDVRDDREERRKHRDRSRSKETSSRKPKRISEEKPSQRDYDAEERIGTEDSKRDDSSDDASKSDNMDIANSP